MLRHVKALFYQILRLGPIFMLMRIHLITKCYYFEKDDDILVAIIISLYLLVNHMLACYINA